jgi:hypothetical protein
MLDKKIQDKSGVRMACVEVVLKLFSFGEIGIFLVAVNNAPAG